MTKSRPGKIEYSPTDRWRSPVAPLGRSTVHVEGAQLIRDWIAKMDTTDPRFPLCDDF
jgi:hypothetical protein